MSRCLCGYYDARLLAKYCQKCGILFQSANAVKPQPVETAQESTK